MDTIKFTNSNVGPHTAYMPTTFCLVMQGFFFFIRDANSYQWQLKKFAALQNHVSSSSNSSWYSKSSRIMYLASAVNWGELRSSSFVWPFLNFSYLWLRDKYCYTIKSYVNMFKMQPKFLKRTAINLYGTTTRVYATPLMHMELKPEVNHNIDP